ncbi:MAG: hypothetical protein ACO3R6_13305, partial [Lutimaribacter sp.]
MQRLLSLLSFLALVALAAVPAQAQQQSGPLRIEITEGVIEPLPFALPSFVAETAGAQDLADQISRVVAADLVGTGLFREIPQSAFISSLTSFASPVQFADWRAINAQALIAGAVTIGSGGRLTVEEHREKSSWLFGQSFPR